MSRTRVLVEHENPRVREAQVATLEAAGFTVATCPEARWPHAHTCALVAYGRCPVAETADVIVNGLPLTRLGIYVAQRDHLPDHRVLLALAPEEQARHPILTGLAAPIERNLTGHALVEAVRAAANRADDTAP